MKNCPKFIKKNILYDLYYNHNKNLKQISIILNCGQSTVFSYMKLYNFKTRPRIAWNKGLTKETDERVLDYAIKRKDYVAKTGCMKGEANPFSGRKHTEETCSHLSKVHGGTGVPYENRKYPKQFCQIREVIRKRDDYRCQRPDCTMTQEENIIVYGRDLDIHHIDYNKQNCDASNLITLCMGCHTRTGVNRDYWQPILTAKAATLNQG